MMRAGACGVGLAALLAVACATTDVTPIGPRRPAREQGCAIEIFQAAPSYPVVPVASARVTYEGQPVEGIGNVDSYLHAVACSYGADTVFDVHQTRNATNTTIAATIGLRNGNAAPRSAAPGPAP